MSSSDSDMAGSEAQPSASLVQARDTWGPPSMASDFLCYLCMKPHNVTVKYKTVCLHTECYDAVRCHNRLLAGKPNLLKDCDRMMICQPEPWRNKIAPLVATRDGGRDKSHMKTLKTKYEEVEDIEFHQDFVDEECSLVDAEEFIERQRQEVNEDLDSDEGRQDFQFLLDEQHKQGKKPKGSDGCFRLAYGRIKYKLKSSRGVQKNIKKVRRKDFDKTPQSKSKPALRAHSPGRSSCPSTLPIQVASRPRSQKSLTAMLEDTIGDDARSTADSQLDDATSGMPPEMAGAFRAFLKTQQSPEASSQVAVQESPSKDDEQPEPSAKKRIKKIPSHAGLAESAAQGKVLNSTEFLQAKVALAMSTKNVEA